MYGNYIVIIIFFSNQLTANELPELWDRTSIGKIAYIDVIMDYGYGDHELFIKLEFPYSENKNDCRIYIGKCWKEDWEEALNWKIGELVYIFPQDFRLFNINRSIWVTANIKQ